MSPVAALEPISVREAQDFEQIYREHALLVYRTAWGVLGNPEDAEDVVQAIFLKLLRHECPPQFRKTRERIRANVGPKPALIDSSLRLEGGEARRGENGKNERPRHLGES